MPYTEDKASTEGKSLSPSAPKKGPYSHAEIRAAVTAAIRSNERDYGPFRRKAGKYYRGEPFGDEQPGRSSVVLTEVRDAVQLQLAQLLPIFFGPDGVVEFVPRHEDAAVARQRTKVVRYVFEELNQGFLATHAAFKDALVRRLGVMKWWWEEEEVEEVTSYSNLTPKDLEVLLSLSPDAEVRDLREDEEGVISSVSIVRPVKRGKVCVAAVPTEDFCWNRSARSLDRATVVVHLTERARWELEALYDKETVARAAANGGAFSRTIEREARSVTGVAGGNPLTEDATEEPITHVEAYIRCTENGRVSIRQYCMIGAELDIVSEEVVPEIPFAVFTPDPEPHEIVGTSTSDCLMELQLLNSHIARGILNSFALSIHPRTVYQEGAVSLSDLMNLEMGGLIRSDNVDAVREFTHTFLGQPGLGVLQAFQNIRDDRIGVSRQAAGIRPDTLQSTAPEVIETSVARGDQRIALIARCFAEGLKGVFVGVYNLLRRHHQKELEVLIGGEPVRVYPSEWPPMPDVRVRVALGGGTRAEKALALEMIRAEQEKQLTALGPAGPLTDLSQYRTTLAEIATLFGLDPARFWKPLTPEGVEELAQANATASQEPDPAMLLAQAQVQVDQARVQLEAEKVRAEQAYKLALAQMQDAQAQRADQRQREVAAAELALKAREIELRYDAAVETATIRAVSTRAPEESGQTVAPVEAASPAGQPTLFAEEGTQ